MRTRSFVIGALAAIAASGLIASCGDDPRSNLPTGASPFQAAGVQISGPSSVEPGRTAQFTVVAFESGGPSKLATSPTARWTSSNASMLSVNAGGLATAGSQRGEATLTVEVTLGGPGTTRRATREIVVLPDGTYRVVGRVTDADALGSGIPGALVAVAGTSLSATTNQNGEYRLYGVPPDADLQVTADDYDSKAQSVHLTANATVDFQLALSGELLRLAGNFTLAIDVLDACSGSSSPLPSALQHRSYEAVITQHRAALTVLLTEPRFRLEPDPVSVRGNRFRGQAVNGGATFLLAYSYDPDYYYSIDYPDVAERLPDGSFLAVQGTTVATGSASGVSGSLNGRIDQMSPGFPYAGTVLATCSGALRFSLTPR